MARTKKVLIGTVSKEAAAEALAAYTEAVAKSTNLNEEMRVKIEKITKLYESNLTELAMIKAEAFEVLEQYATNNRDAFGKKKSMEFATGTIGFRTGTIGFRTGTPALKPLKGFTWTSVTELLKVHLPGYVRTKSEPEKALLLADRAMPEVMNKMATIGIQVVQDETFFIEAKEAETTA